MKVQVIKNTNGMTGRFKILAELNLEQDKFRGQVSAELKNTATLQQKKSRKTAGKIFTMSLLMFLAMGCSLLLLSFSPLFFLVLSVTLMIYTLSKAESVPEDLEDF